jgi:protocatechuate 3,4-dioxygenase, beta subunit
MRLHIRIIMGSVLLATSWSCTLVSCKGQSEKATLPNNRSTTTTTIVGGGCEGCELMYIGMPATIAATDTSPGWSAARQPLMITGKVLKTDGKTPAAGVILYYWQTDEKGYYTPGEGMDERARHHGYIRGWMKTDSNGQYTLYTNRPGPYPNDSMAAHIHLSVREPQLQQEYYIDDWVFDDDPLLTGRKRKALENRGGSGILRVLRKGNLQVAEHDIILGLHIPNHPDSAGTAAASGLSIGEDCPSFIPYHAYGPDKGSRACPVCKYGRYHGLLYFVGNRPDWEAIKKWLVFLEEESSKRSKYLKVYLVYGNSNGYNPAEREKTLAAIGKTLNIQHLALTYVPSFTDATTEVNLYKIDPEAENTFILYRHRTLIDKWINLRPEPANFLRIAQTLDQTQSVYSDLPEAAHD